MGERGARNEAATAEDIAEMSAIVKEGIQAGALGFSTSRTMGHKALNGEPVPGTFAAEDASGGANAALGPAFAIPKPACRRQGLSRFPDHARNLPLVPPGCFRFTRACRADVGDSFEGDCGW